MATNNREARRRKILERGSDRFALITGRIQTLPSSSSSSLPETPQTQDPSPPPPPPLSDVDDQIAAGSFPEVASEIEPDSTFQSETTTSEALRAIDSQVQQLLSSLTAQNAPRQPNPQPDPEPEPEPVLYQQQMPPPVFSTTGLINAISETERIRISFSVFVAVLVVLVHVGFPVLGRRSVVKTLLGFRPLYMVLLTNVTFVLGRILGKKRVPGWFGDVGNVREGVDWYDRLGKALEIGLVAQKVIDALFMDCAVYAVIVVCGLSSFG